MAITITVEELRNPLRVGDDPAETAELTRVHGFASVAITKHLGASFAATPDIIANEAVIRLAAYMYDQPTITAGRSVSNAIVNSGAAATLLPYRAHSAGTASEAVAQAINTGSADNPVIGLPVIGLTLTGSALTVSYQDGTTTVLDLGGLGGGGPGVDQIARDAATTAQARADNAFTAAGDAQTDAGTALTLAGTKDDAFPWATEGNTDAIPAAKHRLATSTERGAVAGAGTNALVDAETGNVIRGWSIAHIFRALVRGVEAWARTGANTLIPPAKLFGLNFPTNRTVTVNTSGNFQLIEGGPGGGGTPLVLTREDVTRITLVDAVIEDLSFSTVNVAVDTGIVVPAGTKTILVNYGASNDGENSGIDLSWFAIPIEEWDRIEIAEVGDGPTAGSARFTRTWRQDNITATGGTAARQVWIGKGSNERILSWSDNTGWSAIPFRVRCEVHETVTVVTNATLTA